MDNSTRYECAITANVNITATINIHESALMITDSEAICKFLFRIFFGDSNDSFLLDSENGFCDHEVTNNTPHGNYSWVETEAGKSTILECFYGPTRKAGDGGRARRNCSGPRMWLDYIGDECITVITFRFRQLANVRW